jgi:tetratricopeptide (TPR) repeat protein
MKKIILLSITILFSLTQTYASDLQKLVKEGNEYCKKSQYDKAIASYQAVIKEGYASSDLYFNLGYSYFKSKNYTKAILYFEKAKILAPADKDITYNLEYARSFTIDKIEEIPEVFLVTWFKALRDQLSLNAWTILSILSFIVTIVFYLIFLLSKSIIWKKTAFWTGTITLIFTLWSLSSAYSHYSAQTNHNTAIVFNPMVNIKSSPSETGNNLFILHEGTKVEILDIVGEWGEIKISSGGRGFIKLSDLEVI